MLSTQEIERYTQQGYKLKYGVLWSTLEGHPRPDWKIEQDCYLRKNGCDRSSKWLGRAEHLKNYISLVMGHEKCTQPFEWNPNACQIVEDYINNDWNAFVGHASSGKTRTCAAIWVAEFLFDPENTGCIVTTTTVKDGKRRVWADIARCWHDATTFFAMYFGVDHNNFEIAETVMPGQIVPSETLIRYRDPNTGRKDEARGIVLAPSNEKEAENGIGRMKGFKAPRLRILMDEASDMSMKIVEAVESNMVAGCDDFKCCAALNANDLFDTGGTLCEPKDGWGSVDVNELDEWDGKRCHVRRFDAEKSPNVLLAMEGKIADNQKYWKGLVDKATVDDRRANLPPPAYKRQYRAQWPTEGTSDSLYTMDILKRHGALSDANWKEILHLVGGNDPAWTHDGDRVPLVRLNYGEDEEGRMILEYHSYEYLDTHVPDDQDRKFFIANALRKACESADRPRMAIQNKHLGIDTTGGGDLYASIVADQWGNQFHRVNFKASASDKRVSADNPTLASERFANKRSELWAIGLNLLMGGQLRGLQRCPELLKQLKDATYEEKNKKIWVEDKASMKKRLGYSPDLADAFWIAVDVARQKLGLVPSNKPMKIQVENTAQRGEFDFSALQKKPNRGFRFALNKFDTSWRK